MTKSARFFRVLWRINAILFFLAFAALVVFVGCYWLLEGIHSAQKTPEPPAPVKTPQNVQLEFGEFDDLEPSYVRVDLVTRDSERGGSFSKGESSQTRNILLVETTTGTAHWLLPDHDHVITEEHWLDDPADKHRADVLLVKPAADAEGNGRLLLTDNSMQHVVELASDVQRVTGSTLNGNTISIITSRYGKLRLIDADANTLVKTLDRALAVPALH